MNKKGGKLKLLSKGSNSEIYEYGSGGSSVVLKVVSSNSPRQAKHLANECSILKLLHHRNIIKILKYQQNITLQGTGSNKQLMPTRNALVMQNAKHGNLLQFIRTAKPSLPSSRWIFSQLCQAIRYLHCNYFVHRDIKLENVLVSQKQSQIQIKLADFGFATSFQNQSPLSSSYKGTKRAYMSPEIHQILQSPHQPYHTLKADIFALGVILFTLVMGRFPFQYATSSDSHYKYLLSQNQTQFWKMHQPRLLQVEDQPTAMIDDFKELFIKMVHADPQSRPSIEQVCESEWLKGKKIPIKLQNDYQ